MFTKQHYKVIADIIKTNQRKDDTLFTMAAHLNLVKSLTEYFVKDNDMFDKQKFLKACGL